MDLAIVEHLEALAPEADGSEGCFLIINLFEIRGHEKSHREEPGLRVDSSLVAFPGCDIPTK